MKRARTILKFSNFSRYYSTYSKPKILPNEKVLDDIEQSLYKPRKHPGIVNVKTVTVPESIVSAIQNVLEDYPLKNILNDGVKMKHHLRGRVSPMEPEQIQNLRDEIYTNVLAKEKKKLGDALDETKENLKFRQSIKDKVITKLKLKVYNWSPMTYDAYNSLVYLMTRFPAEYAVLVRVFAEIKQREPDFKPRTMFDFGSGTGTAMWAVNSHWGRLYEYFNVDTSSFMNDLSLLLLQGGRPNKECSVKGVFYRQFLPVNNNMYDIVVSAYSLLELPSVETRMETALKLWNKTGKYLIFIEQGTNGGFRVINEVRDYILQIDDENNQGHVFSPCPHDKVCPRFMTDNTPCNFQISYNTMSLGAKPELRRELYSYVVLKKGKRGKTDEDEWPRVVREPLVRSKHTICRLCSKNGTLDEVIFTASKHGKTTYHCARSTKWGDRLPITTNQFEDSQKVANEDNDSKNV